ncbi:hypothetical protein BWQ96_08060 [Gracilariopsis chorda]|uniref:Uncharacterized protein n=1 Tax=Gracilariopsis chorda TaxID=448386 RepID=A0A2V3IJI2_9FLOR|nr:hypothetical protein BWQ96_08060 [Gracilariopsis chorda]|eukprot:PXF42232.1 hypothetical protein BWQ96_08060 [Gracilariopsis chorda]
MEVVVRAGLLSTIPDYGQVKEAANAIIEKDKQFAAFGHCYHALSLFGSGTNNSKTKIEAVKELDKAVFLLKRLSDQLLGQSQVVSSINNITDEKGLGTDTLAFEKSNSNMQSLLQIQISAAEKITGRAFKEDDFDTSAINRDATKKVFDY